MRLTPRRAGLATATAALALGTTVAGTSAAQAGVGLDVEYDAVGTSTISSTDSTVALGPTTLSTTLDSETGAITGSLPLPPTATEFKVAGFLPVSATVEFIEAAPVTGALIRTGNVTTVEATASYTIRLKNVKMAGLPAFVGNTCQTKAPVSIPVNTPEGSTFNIITGGQLEGEYAIGKFGDCGLSTGLINLIVPGAGNTVDLTVSNGRLG